jgi:hypothetical protein
LILNPHRFFFLPFDQKSVIEYDSLYVQDLRGLFSNTRQGMK